MNCLQYEICEFEDDCLLSLSIVMDDTHQDVPDSSERFNE